MSDLSQYKMTAAEFFALPEMFGVNELIDGQLYSHQPLDIHQATLGNILIELYPITEAGELRLVRTSVQLDDQTVVQPDLFWVAHSKSLCKLGNDGYWHGAPDFVVEVLSPGTTRQDRHVKYALYEKHGVREYWIVDAMELYIEVYVLRNERFERLGVFGLGEQLNSLVLGQTFNVDALLKS